MSNDTADISALTGGIQVIRPVIVLLESRGEPRCDEILDDAHALLLRGAAAAFSLLAIPTHGSLAQTGSAPYPSV